jgi:hypothetical protein
MPLSLEEQYFAADTVNVIARLLALDRIRTDYLQRAERPIPEQAVQNLQNLTGEMDVLLEMAQERARDLNSVIREHRDELYDGYRRMLSSDELTEDQKDRLEDAPRRYGRDIAEYGMTSVEVVVARAPTERETLRTEMRNIRRGGFAAGDLSPQFLCNLAGACIVSGLFAPPPMNIVGVVIGILAIVHVEATGEEC